MADKAIRVPTAMIDAARSELMDLVSSRRLNFLMSEGSIGVDARLRGMTGVDGIARLLAYHISAVNLNPSGGPAAIADRAFVEAGLIALIHLLREASARVAHDDHNPLSGPLDKMR